MKFFLAGDLLGHIELSADLGCAIEQIHAVAAFCQHGRAGETGRTGTDDGDAFLFCGGQINQLSFITGAWIDQARSAFLFENVVKTGLIAADAGVDFVRTSSCCFEYEFRIGQQWPRHRNHVGTTISDNFLRDIGRIDTIGRDERNAHFAFEFFCDPRECAAGDRGRDSRYPRLMPADTGVDDRGTGLFDGFG